MPQIDIHDINLVIVIVRRRKRQYLVYFWSLIAISTIWLFVILGLRLKDIVALVDFTASTVLPYCSTFYPFNTYKKLSTTLERLEYHEQRLDGAPDDDPDWPAVKQFIERVLGGDYT